MRISDWSSDVCSSDLVGAEQHRRAIGRALDDGRGRRQVLPENGVGGQKRGENGAGGGNETHEAAQPSSRCSSQAIPTIHTIPPGENGRASCRERVCQYGSITGVSCTLKKKTN